MKNKGLIVCFPSNTKSYQIIISAGEESSLGYQKKA